MSQYLIDRIASLSDTAVLSLSSDSAGLTGVNTRGPQGGHSFKVRHLFLFTGAEPNTRWLRDCSVDTDDKGFVLTGNAARSGLEQQPCLVETSVKRRVRHRRCALRLDQAGIGGLERACPSSRRFMNFWPRIGYIEAETSCAQARST
ncbi:hypothetical protein QCE62_25445 [Caballeronia sp. LZ033]|uniref:hypothetical protein n=1 Tax=Caballeronia sp. LZ033 TaxID=3038566 RepID=UPI00285F2A5B|nr:hypothetical protein [Caballeronia sp. LZ033]MDR5816949.1 hypothetical protein [Caballeronia sp. LZ033]